jgi:hypothetical protein
MSLEQKLNFPLDKADLKVFGSKPPGYTAKNSEALSLIIDGIIFSEFPRYNLGLSAEIFEKMHISDILSIYAGIGKLKRDKFIEKTIKSVDTKITYDEILNLCEEKKYGEAVSALVGYGQRYNAIRVLNRKGGEKQRISLRKLVDSMSDAAKDQLAKTLKASKDFYISSNWRGNYPIDDKESSIKESIGYLYNLIQSIYSAKDGEEFEWCLGDNIKGNNIIGIQHKFISQSKGRVGAVYFVWEIHKEDNIKYQCSCPANPRVTECKHIEAVKTD